MEKHAMEMLCLRFNEFSEIFETVKKINDVKQTKDEENNKQFSKMREDIETIMIVKSILKNHCNVRNIIAIIIALSRIDKAIFSEYCTKKLEKKYPEDYDYTVQCCLYVIELTKTMMHDLERDKEKTNAYINPNVFDILNLYNSKTIQ